MTLHAVVTALELGALGAVAGVLGTLVELGGGFIIVPLKRDRVDSRVYENSRYRADRTAGLGRSRSMKLTFFSATTGPTTLPRRIGVMAIVLLSTSLSSCASPSSASSSDGQFAATDRSFVDIAARTDARELANAQFAVRTTGDPVIAEYARKAAVHAGDERSNLEHFASEVGIALPATDGITADAAFGKLRGRRFDRAYLDADRADRSRAIDAFRSEVNAGSQRTLAAYALGALPNMDRMQSLAQSDITYLNDPIQYGELVPLR